MKKYIVYTISTLFLFSCTDLEEDLDGLFEESGLSSQAVVTGQLSAAYNQLQSFQNSDSFQFTLLQHSTDEMAGPTRGAGWDDGGQWRALHLHEWNSSHSKISGAWSQNLGGLFAAIDALSNEPTADQKAAATFYSSFYMFYNLDIWGQVPYREPGSSYGEIPIVLKRTEAIDLAIDQLEEVFSDLPNSSANNTATQYAAAALLAKLYVNKAVYKATDEDGTPQAGPFTFDSSDMQKVIDYCDIIIDSGSFTLQTNYFDSFAPNNTAIATENIFVSENDNNTGGAMRRMYYMTLNENHNPGGWNGFVALTDLYDKFDSADPRIGSDYSGLTDVTGLKVGFLIGQQFDQNGNMLIDNQNNPMNFTRDFSLANSSSSQGIRAVKYSPDLSNIDRPANDYVFFRLADVYLMKAEAMARMGNDPSGPLTTLRVARGVDAVYTGTSLDDILDERSRELYWEGWRRNDQIRFGTFLDPVQQKSSTSDRTKLIYPIPATALSTNPNLIQNPGY
ncbi:RagB/SusD family nutrient uptake outer membrane protein [uncultured Maribacter sp.]|uniref:RagB/SusD family nutrient uptake outer membrane protein n=1 Tax=uncultured Maribacter sp. TaxID=431308 RepID=UPI0026049CB5|nr:RagB/SusD family nutrient uptake outer membrane protein [uncultured Maribacter sp.]